MNDTEKNINFTVNEFAKAIEALKTSVQLLKDHINASPAHIELHKALRDACIQRFEFCVELGWRTAIKALGSDAKAPNPAIREMARNGLIDTPQIWFDFLTARNKTSHTYDEEIAKTVFDIAMQALPYFDNLVERIMKTLK